MSIREKILEYMKQPEYKPMLKEQLLVNFGLGKNDKEEFYKIIDSLEKEGLIIKSKDERYNILDNSFLVAGTLQGHEKGFGFVVNKDPERDDIFIPAENMSGAMNGDRVIVNITNRSSTDRRDEGEIIRILERKNTHLVGTFEESKNFGFLIPDDKKIFYDVFIPKSHTNGAKNRQKVVVEITKWPEARRNPEGKVIEVLGYIDEKGTDVLSIIRQFELPEEFPKKVREFAKKIPQTIPEEEIEKRVDLRGIKTFTIDGADAKDLDDAISIEKLENGNFKLGVHIADVSHYVREGNELDIEAYKRGTSVYLIDRVVPMLPEELSNGICSLNPDEDRLSLSVIMEIDSKGIVIDHEIVEGVIKSDARLVYEDVSDYLEDKDEEAKEKLKDLLDELEYMEELMKILYEKRRARGSIDFNFPETQIVLDEKGRPVEIKKADRRIANRLIEEFMLVTNETVAERFFWSEIPFLYRIHENPAEEKIEAFNKLIHNFGYVIKGKEVHPKDLQMLVEEVEGKKEEPLISALLLRSLRKAKYSSEPDIHFGLASKYYSHFTAPIRRYPDLVIHRIIKQYINGELTENRQEHLKGNMSEIAEHTSMTERRAEEAEREVEDLKMAQYMMSRIGEEYEGIISSLTSFGIFVQLDNTIEGLVHFNNMIDDYYIFDEENYYVIGERTKRIYRLGDIVKIQVIDVDISRRSIDFQIIDEN